MGTRSLIGTWADDRSVPFRCSYGDLHKKAIMFALLLCCKAKSPKRLQRLVPMPFRFAAFEKPWECDRSSELGNDRSIPFRCSHGDLHQGGHHVCTYITYDKGLENGVWTGEKRGLDREAGEVNYSQNRLI